MPEKETNLSPSNFMRQLRPDFYSDTRDRTAYQLDSTMLEYHLDNITARNQTHEFEIFCRKLCERTICPNLKPSTGPEGGGDSKADAESIPVADEVATLTYVGEPNAGKERWAFAFSAKKTWAEKARNDVAGIVETRRNYQKIYYVTARFARARDRARVEDELSKKYGLEVTILDRNWIVGQVVDSDHRDLAFNFLGVGQEITNSHRLGPADYSRSRQLEDIEKLIASSNTFKGLETQHATEALVAAKLSRNLERPRPETDGRFARAIRFAERGGTFRQKLEANYEQIWTAFWWFDDVEYLNNRYDAFETLVIDTGNAKNLEFLCNLAQLLFNSVIHQHLTHDEAKLEGRITRLRESLKMIVADRKNPNNSLEALTSLLVLDVNQAILMGDSLLLSSLWPKFSEVIKQAKGLGEYSADRLTKMIEVFGHVAGKDKGYSQLLDETATFTSERTGEAQGALVLLRRAQQLDFEDNFEIIRLLGKAARQLAKKEYVEELIEATQLLTFAYRNVGLLWAARATCIFSITSIFIEAEENSDPPSSIVLTVSLLAWIVLELRHLPDTLEAIRLIQGFMAKFQLNEAHKESIGKSLMEFDLILGSQLLNFTFTELEQIVDLPSVLERLGLHQSRIALLYVLGHEALLRKEGSLPDEESPESIEECFNLLASQPVSNNLHRPVVFNQSYPSAYMSRVLGMQVLVHYSGSETSILVAEAIVGTIEGLFATALEVGVVAHTESFHVRIRESKEVFEPDFVVDQEQMYATVNWPKDLRPATHERQPEVLRTLASLASAIFAATCFTKDLKQTLESFLINEAALDRVSMIAVVGNSRQRLFNKAVSKLDDWKQLATKSFPLKTTRPKIRSQTLIATKESSDSKEANSGDPPLMRDHRDVGVRSVIDLPLWNRAGWIGVAFANFQPGYPPAIALMFKNEDTARKIFERWRKRFGKTDQADDLYIAIVRRVSVEHPAHYRVLITSRLPSASTNLGDGILTVTSRIQTMHAESDINLERFLQTYKQFQTYFLVPAVSRGGASPAFLMELSILKRKLSVKDASEVKTNDLEIMAIRPGHSQD